MAVASRTHEGASAELLDRYAELVVRVGVISSPVGRSSLRRCSSMRRSCRRSSERRIARVRRVDVNYEDLEVLRSQIELAPEESVGAAPRWMFDQLADMGRRGGRSSG